MPQAQFQFHPHLVYFLPHGKGSEPFAVEFQEAPAVKHLIEALGVPHTEVDRILANGQPVRFHYGVQDNDRIQVFPAEPPPAGEAGPDHQGRPQPEPRFLLDNHLGRLAAYLRMLGFDTLYRNDYQDEELAEVAAREGRILLTRDRRLLMRSAVTYGYSVRSLLPEQQAAEVLRRYRLQGRARPFYRCLRCNEPLRTVSKEEILDRLEPLTRQHYDEFRLCPACNRIFWKGGQYTRMLSLIARLASTE